MTSKLEFAKRSYCRAIQDAKQVIHEMLSEHNEHAIEFIEEFESRIENKRAERVLDMVLKGDEDE